MSRIPANFCFPAARLWQNAVSWLSRWTGRPRTGPVLNPCPLCGADLTDKPRYGAFLICDNCGHHFPFAVRARVRALSDPGTFAEFLAPQPTAARSHWAFTRRVYRATRRRQSVLTGRGEIAGNAVVFIVFDFAMHGGTMSVAAGERIAHAFAFAQENALPVLSVISSGGVRIQEGIPALLQMARTVQAVNDFRQAHRPFIALLTNPTTGGVYASFVSLADVLLAEPNAVLGFAGPRVAQAALGKPSSADSYTPEAALANGMLDMIVQRENQRDILSRLLQVSTPAKLAVGNLRSLGLPAADHSPETSLSLARSTDRPTSKDYIPRLFSDFIDLHGDRLLGDDPTVIGGVGRFENIPVMVIAQQREHRSSGMLGSTPAGYHKAERLIRMAGELHMPIVTLIDTPGADPSYDSERFGIASAIAHCLSALMLAPVPTVSIIIGEATSGGALALAAADRVLMQENAVFAVISPEGASAILYGEGSRATDTLGILGITADDVFPRRIVDAVVPEPEGGAHASPDASAASIRDALYNALAQLIQIPDADRLAQRRHRYLASPGPSSH